MNKQNHIPKYETLLDSEVECQKNGGNLIQFSSIDDMDLMADIFMSHPSNSFFLVNDSFHVGVSTNPHFPFISTSSGKPVLNTTVDPRYLNETANEEGECTVMNYSPSFEDYMNVSGTKLAAQDPNPRFKSSDLTIKAEPWYWNPKHTMQLSPNTCDKQSLSICDHKDSLQAVAYNVSTNSFMDSNRLLNAVGFYIHSMNSLSACVAYCVAKDKILTMIIHGKTCICSKGNYDSFNRYQRNNMN